MKGQISTELLVIVALIMVVFIPLLTLVYLKINEANAQMASYESELAVFRLAYLANSVGSMGTDTRVYTDVYIPENMEEFYIESSGGGGELVMVMDAPEGRVEVVEVITHSVGNTRLLNEGTYGWQRFEVESSYTPDGRAEVSISPS
jgi:hypothetical protein